MASRYQYWKVDYEELKKDDSELQETAKNPLETYRELTEKKKIVEK